MIIQPADHLRMCLVGDVEENNATIDIRRIGTVGPLGVDMDVMRAETGIEFFMAHRRGHVVTLPGARQPPASHLCRLAGITYVNNGIELVIFRISGNKIGRTATDMHIFAIHYASSVCWRGTETLLDLHPTLGNRDCKHIFLGQAPV
jgi:hypothetical protein